MASISASVIKCDYVVSAEYRMFVNRLANSGLSLSKGTWWVERVDGSVGTAYHLSNENTYFGCVRKEELVSGSLELALWNLMKYLEAHSDRDCKFVVFPRNWEGTEFANKSHEFLSVSWRGPTSTWKRFLGSL